MDIASFAHVPDWPRGCIQGVQGVQGVKPETGFKTPNHLPYTAKQPLNAPPVAQKALTLS
jgi:hypothetical protein